MEAVCGEVVGSLDCLSVSTRPFVWRHGCLVSTTGWPCFDWSSLCCPYLAPSH